MREMQVWNWDECITYKTAIVGCLHLNSQNA